MRDEGFFLQIHDRLAGNIKGAEQMSKLKEFLRKAERELNAKREVEEVSAISEAESKHRLAHLAKVEWEELATTMKSIIEGENFDGKPFFWVAPRMVTLGDITLTTLEPREQYQKSTYNAHYQATALGPRPQDIKLVPSLHLEVLRWETVGIISRSKLLTAELAIALVEQLVNFHVAIHAPRASSR